MLFKKADVRMRINNRTFPCRKGIKSRFEFTLSAFEKDILHTQRVINVINIAVVCSPTVLRIANRIRKDRNTHIGICVH